MAMLMQDELTSAPTPSSEMSVEEAAVLLNVSPAYVNKLVEEGKLPGLRREDVLAYDIAEYARQVEGMKELMALTEELGLYDLYPGAAK